MTAASRHASIVNLADYRRARDERRAAENPAGTPVGPRMTKEVAASNRVDSGGGVEHRRRMLRHLESVSSS
jgi:hypothetical protein